MKKVLVLLIILLSVCSIAFAENLDDVLKDCKLDKSHWKVVEWVKTERFVRLYDSASVSVVGSGQFEVVIMDYYYEGDCGKDSCKLRGTKHYHSEKWLFNIIESTGTLLSFETRDIDGNVVDSYKYPAKMQMPEDIKRNSVKGKTMLKAKDVVKDNKDFAAKEPTSSNESKSPTDATPKTQTGFAPLPQPIGSSDGEYTYLGRFIGPNNLTCLESILMMLPFNSSVACDGVYDVYFHHRHALDAYNASGYRDGAFCQVTQRSDGHVFYYSYSCILKLVPLDRNGNRIQKKGVSTLLVHMGVTAKGDYGYGVSKVRLYDTLTHEYVGTIDSWDFLNPKDTTSYSLSKKLNRKSFNDSPFWIATRYSKCPPNFKGYG